MGERLLEPYETYGWRLDSTLSDDDNMMDLLLLVTRSSKLKQGSMACILVRPKQEAEEEETLLSRIQSVANNRDLYTRNHSGIHAEVAAIGDAARNGRPTEHCTAYITMPPCRRCFCALYAAGITRVVTVHKPPAHYLRFADRVEMLGVDDIHEHRMRVQTFLDKCIEEEEEDDDEKHDSGAIEVSSQP